MFAENAHQDIADCQGFLFRTCVRANLSYLCIIGDLFYGVSYFRWYNYVMTITDVVVNKCRGPQIVGKAHFEVVSTVQLGSRGIDLGENDSGVAM